MATSGATMNLRRYEIQRKESYHLANARQVLPPCLSIPLLEICSHLDVPPIATYAGVCLWNYSLRSPMGCVNQLENLRSNTSFTGIIDEEWFYMVSVAIEAQGGPSITDSLDAIKAAYNNDHEKVVECLNSIAENLLHMSVLLGRMNERCSPRPFYTQLRPFLAGTNRMKEFGLPEGLTYDCGHGKRLYRSYKGGSNAQSTLIQFLDTVLGVEHHSDNPKGSAEFTNEMRSYMPGEHRRFLEEVSKIANIKTFVHDNRAHTELQAAYNRCIQGMCRIRDTHFQIVARFILLQSKKGSGHNHRLLNSPQDDPVPRGTGGTDLVRFLQKTREETAKCRVQKSTTVVDNP